MCQEAGCRALQSAAVARAKKALRLRDKGVGLIGVDPSPGRTSVAGKSPVTRAAAASIVMNRGTTRMIKKLLCTVALSAWVASPAAQAELEI